MFKKVLTTISLLILIAVIGLSIFFYVSFKSGNLQKFALGVLANKSSEQNEVLFGESGIIQTILGFDEPQHYLLLFLNNTEIRPGGGFIGSYAVVKIEDGKPEILKVEGTETLDGKSPKFESIPPIQLAKHLKIETWKFRDSNWSPDFIESSNKALELYKKEKGLAAEDIDAVVGVTPTVFENILKIMGPITVDGIEFNDHDFTEKLEYEVEYGYDEKGKDFRERKEIMGSLAKIMLPKFKKDVILNWSEYYNLFEDMIDQKQLMFYSLNPQVQDYLLLKNWSPKVGKTDSDYLMWVDANLGAWKTDFSIERDLEYKISPTESGRFVGEVKMSYKHIGNFDWRTTRYLSYVRLYLPIGVELIEIIGGDKSSDEYKESNFGIELDKQWYGTMVKIEPQTDKELIFKFYLSSKIVDQIKDGEYDLLVQKQLGSLDNGLTLDFNFGKNVISAEPSELEKKWGDVKYEFDTDLIIDREFSVKLEK